MRPSGHAAHGTQPRGPSPPGIQDRRRRRLSQHLGDRAQQVLADDRIVFGLDLQAGMLVRDPLHHATQPVQPADMFGIGQHGRGQAARLRAVAALVGGIEVVEQLWMVAEHPSVEGARDRFTMRAQSRHRGLDDRAVFVGKHGQWFLVAVPAGSVRL